MILLSGIVEAYDGQRLTIVAPYENTSEFIRKKYRECEIRLDDGRGISVDQRKKIYATFRDISLYTGFTPEETKDYMKCEYIARTGADWFSLSDTDMTTARDFLNFLIEFCLEQDIPTSNNLLNRSPDIARYVYACLVHKKCCISGKKAELHHVDAVGMGRDRKEIVHLGMRVLPLSRKFHAEAHTIGTTSFEEKYHLFGIRLDRTLCQIWNVKGEEALC